MRYGILLFTILLLLPQTAFSEERARTISVGGTAEVTVKAEHALVHAQLKVVSPSVEESYESVSRLLTELASTLEPLGVTREQLVASAITQGTEYEWSNNTRTVQGYYSTCSLQIKIQNIQDTYRVHRSLAGFQHLSISHTEYGRSDETLLKTSALQQALQAAKTKAQAMAETMGASLGEVLHIRESEGPHIPVPRMEARLAAAADNPADVATTGFVTVSGSVSVDFALK